MPDRLLTTRELVDQLQIDRVTIYRMVKDGRLPALRVGGQWRFSANVIDAWLTQHDHKAIPITSASASAQPQDPQLSDLIPVQMLKSIQDEFAAVLGVSSFVTNLDGQPLAPCSRCSRFCQLVYGTEVGMASCQNSWRNVAQSSQAGAHIHTCHAGIHYASAPVLFNGQRIGMVTAGQFLTEPADNAAFRRQALATGERIGADGEALAAFQDSLEIVSEERSIAITRLLAVIANTLSHIGYQSYLAHQALVKITEIGQAVLPTKTAEATS